MAIFIASTKSISRGSGQSAVASASYRAGVALEDKRYGKIHDYSKKHGVMSADIILPSALVAANADIDRCDLWNKAESAEKRKDARVAREWLVNLPHELSEQDRKELAHTFAQTLADRYGTIADCAIHEPTQKEVDRGADPRNYHAHIMFTTRSAALDDNNEIVLTDKATIELSDKKRRTLGLERVSDEIKAVRLIWEQIANDKLAQYHHGRIDSRSYAEQGIDIEPQFKMGSVATKLERDAYETAKAEAKNKDEVFTGIDPVTVRGKMNAMIAERNQRVKQRQANKEKVYDTILEYIADNTKRTRVAKTIIAKTARRIEHTIEYITWANGRIGDIDLEIESRERYSEYANRLVEYAIGEFDGAADSRTREKSSLSHSQSTVDALQRAITDGERDTQSANQHLERATCECDRTARHSEQTKRYLARPRPSPFRERISATKQRINATKRRVADSEQGVDDRYREARSRQEEFDRATRRTKTIVSGRAKYLLAVFARPTEQGFDERQLATFKAFAAEKRFKSLEEMRVFFSDYDNAKQHKAFVSMMLYPEKERRTFSEAHQTLETSLEGKDTKLDSKALEIENIANISLPNEPTVPVRRKYRP